MSVISRWLQNAATVLSFPCLIYEEVVVDFSKQSCASADVINLFNVQAGCRVLKVLYHVDTAEGATLTGTIGDGDSVARYEASANLNSAGSGQLLGTLEATDSSGVGFKYAAADTIDLVLANAAATAKVTFILIAFSSRV